MIRNALLVFLSRNVQKGAAVIIYALVARRLGPEGVGIYGLLVWLPVFVTAIGSLGLGPAHAHLRGQGRITVREVLGNAVVAAATFGVLAVVVFTLLRPFLRLDADMPLLVTLITLVFPVSILQNYLDYLWIGEDRIGLYSILESARYLTLLGLVVLALATTRPLLAVAAVVVLNAVLMALVGLVLVWRHFGLTIRFAPATFAAAVRYGARVHTGTVAQAIGYRFDYFLVNYFVGTAGLGLYVAATNLAEVVWILPSAVAAALLPRVSVSDAVAARELAARASRATTALAVMVGVLALVVAELVLRLLYGAPFSAAATAMRILLAGTIALAPQRILANYFIGQGYARWFQRVTLVSVAVNLGLNLLLLRALNWGPEGAALASAVSYSLTTTLLVALYMRLWGGSPLRLLLPTADDWAEAAEMFRRLFRKPRTPEQPRV